MNTDKILHELAQPLNPAHVCKRSASGKALSYLESHHVIARLNEIFGYDGWRDRVCDYDVVPGASKPMMRCTVEIEARIGDHWVTHCGVGAAICQSDKAESYETALKDAESDAVKRAARKFGPQFGLELYEKDAPEHHGQWRAAPVAHSPATACTEQQVAFYEHARDSPGRLASRRSPAQFQLVRHSRNSTRNSPRWPKW